MQSVFQDVSDYIETNSDRKPVEPFARELWLDFVEDLFSEIDDLMTVSTKEAIIEVVPSFYQHANAKRISKDIEKRRKRLEELCNLPQIEQRTKEWYKQAFEILTGSQTGALLGSKRTRGKLVLSKVNRSEEGEETQQRRHAVWSHETNPFDWGIRFEPVAKMIYEYLTKTRVRELGRIVHPNPELKIAASPDGIIESCETGERLGILVEFKAPISRIIEDGELPKDYWCQQQVQMEVTDIDRNDYFEVVLRSPSKSSTQIEGPALLYGYVYTIGCVQPPYEDPQPYRYVYGKLNEGPVDIPLQDGETLLETLPWDLMAYNLIPVTRSTTWFETVMVPAIKEFWEDVEKAKEGTFNLPEGRKMKAKGCLIKDDNDDVIAVKEPPSKKPHYEFIVDKSPE